MRLACWRWRPAIADFSNALNYVCGLMLRKDCFGVTPKPTRDTRALPGRYRRRACLPFDDDHCNGVMLGMTQTDPGGLHRPLLGEGVGSAVKDQKRLAAFFLVHVDIAPAHRFPNASAERFRHRFFRRKPGREMARWKFHRLAIGDLALGKNPLHKTLTKTIDRVLNALDLDHVHANAEHAHDKFFVWGAHAPRVLAMAPSPSLTFLFDTLRRGAAMSTRGGTVGLWQFWAKNAHFSTFLTIKTASRKN